MLLTAGSAQAQPTDFYVTGQRQPVQVAFSTVFQQYEDGATVQQVSFPLVVRVPVGERFGASLQASGALAGGDALADLGGLADVQVGLTYRQPIGEGSVVASLGANLPSGRSGLSPDEFATSVVLSRDSYAFAQPGFGRGFALSPGLTLAYPIGDGLAVGAGAAYQYKSGFTPVSSMEGDYVPGDELILTGGVDVRLGTAAALSGDVAYTRYAVDELGGAEYYQAGDRLAFSVQYLAFFGFDELRLFLRYSSKSRGEVPTFEGVFVPEAQRAVPSNGRASLSYLKRTSERTSLQVLLAGRRYEETDLFEENTLLDVGLLPELRVSSEVRLVSRFIYTLGSFTGLTAGMGIEANL